MREELFMQIAMCLVSVLGAIITYYVIPYIKSRFSESELAKLEKYICIAIKCAEQIYTPEQWQEKKDYVMDYITELLGNVINVKITREQLDTLVEGLVFQIKKEGK